MHTFKQATYFVRDVLDHATDAQLQFSGMTPYERDRLLSRDVTFGKQYRESAATFHKFPSIIDNTSHIHFQRSMDLNDSLETAAHEQFHAARFWGNSASLTQTIMAPVTAVSIALHVANLITDLPLPHHVPSLFVWGCGLTLHGLNSMHNSYQEELEAFRFGYLFSPDTYKAKSDDAVLDCSYPFDPYKLRKKSNKSYPTSTERLDLYLHTKQECIGGNILFPDASPKAAFKEWRKQNGHILS